MWKSIACVCLVCVACVDSPRSESTLAQRTDALHVSGLFETPDTDLDVEIYSHVREAWTRFATLRTRAADPLVDATGRPYFRYAGNLALPQAPEYWLAHQHAARIEARVRVRFGQRVLQTFGSDAESCARRAHDQGKDERHALDACASSQAYARVFVAACGGEGEPCCSDAAESCQDDNLCHAGVCEAARHVSPVLRGYQVDLAVPSGYVLHDAVLVLDDTSAERDSERPLLVGGRPLAGVAYERPHPNVERLVFDFGFWKPGVNRFFVRGDAVKGASHRRVESAVAQLEYEVPRSFGAVEPGVFRLPAPAFARTFSKCAGPACKDRDGDGLNDLWENLALHQLRPRLMLDAADDLFTRKKDVVRVLGSVLPIDKDGEPYVLFASVIAFSRDYGHSIGWSHAGDTEAFGMLFRVGPDDTLRWVASAAKGHACLTCGPRFQWHRQEFAEDGTPLLYVEEDKHGLWQSGRECREHAAFRCRGDRSLRPDAVNVGDFSPEGARALVDGLDGLLPDGPFGTLAGAFPGDAVWTARRARVPGRFCGGARDCARSASANMPGAVIAGLVKLFEKRDL